MRSKQVLSIVWGLHAGRDGWKNRRKRILRVNRRSIRYFDYVKQFRSN